METKEKLTEIIGNVVVNDKGNRIRDVFHPEFVEKIVENLIKHNTITPPCKVGDIVYVADNGGIKDATVNEMYFHGGTDWVVLLSFDCDYECKNCPFSAWYQDYSGERSCGGEYGCWDIGFKDFGKTVFLTREEAEAALKGE